VPVRRAAAEERPAGSAPAGAEDDPPTADSPAATEPDPPAVAEPEAPAADWLAADPPATGSPSGEPDTVAEPVSRPPGRMRRLADRMFAERDRDHERRAPGKAAKRGLSLAGELAFTAAVLATVVVVVGVLFVAFGANTSNSIVSGFHTAADFLVGPFHGLFHLTKPKHTVVLNWVIAAVVYLVAGFIIRRLLKTSK
jgi:hypothetical protein